MTAGEGEFLSLAPERQRRKLEAGLELWNSCGLAKPAGFVPPAWLHRPDLLPTLWDMGFSWTENHQGLRFSSRPAVRSPVITWASRDAVRRIGSLAFAPLALRAWRQEAVLRIAIHPHDWDHPSLIRSIRATLRSAIRLRPAISGPLQA